MVVAPSVFTGHCLRPLTQKELSRVFEVPEGVFCTLDSISEKLPFFKAAPVSVLLHFGQQVFLTPTNVLTSRPRTKSDSPAELPSVPLEKRQEEKATL